MRERPILFSGPMVRAILEGRKTQTRRVGRAQNSAATELAVEDCVATYRAFPGAGSARWGLCSCPYGVPGDRLWVRETWEHEDGGCDDHKCGQPTHIYYRATECYPESMHWRPSIFMPRWASRLTLEVVSVRVERLQEISVGDIRAEGFEEPPLTPGVHFCIDGELWPAGERKIREAFGSGWDTINCKRAPWASNPWVWVVEFKVAA